ncbi:MAG: methyl-accepting chemotaxis protein [Hylemonella sp.]|nr:methyl-accepting chemotaxis protein [Hylemonella sp.]MDP1936482.1 methyl-accepting chemotaxis protein [Hylemonella sp.]
MNHTFSVAVTPTPPTAVAAATTVAGLSLVNLAARQRMLSQRMILQTVLASQGDAVKLEEARKSLHVFTESQQHLQGTPRQLEASSARKIEATYHGAQGVAHVIEAFISLVRTTLDHIAHRSARQADTLAELVSHTDKVLAALNTATTAFDEITKAKSDAMMRELSGIVGDIQSVAKEAKVVSFNAQVMAARAGQHGREFAVVATVLSNITGEIDGLTRKAMLLADRNKLAA